MVLFHHQLIMDFKCSFVTSIFIKTIQRFAECYGGIKENQNFFIRKKEKLLFNKRVDILREYLGVNSFYKNFL